jgi:hypothetical protein
MEVKCLGCGYIRKYLLKPKRAKASVAKDSCVKDGLSAKCHLVKQGKNKRISNAGKRPPAHPFW